MEQPTAARSRQDRLIEAIPALCAVAAVVVVCIVNQHPGHDWGDDFALYLRQGRSIVDGNVSHVLAVNKLTVQNSSWHTFSPYSYPWGWPLMIAPIYALWGLNYGVLKIVEALLFAGFLLTLLAIVTRRIGRPGAFAVFTMVGFGLSYVGWTDTVLSEFPYLLFVGLTLWWHDRCRTRGVFRSGPRWPLVVLGLFAAYAYSIRRDGLAVIAALALWDVVDVVRSRERGTPWSTVLRAADWGRRAVPYVTAIVFVAGLQLVLPSVLFQRYPGAGLRRLWPNVVWFRDILAEQLALKDQGADHLGLLGSSTLAKVLLALFLVAAVGGLVVRAVGALAIDAVLIGYLVTVCVIVGVQPFHEGRYLFSITPLLAYFAYQGVAALAGSLAGRRAATITATAFVAVFALTNVVTLYHHTARRVDERHATLWGPSDPRAQEMFAAVRDLVGPQDVISFFRARAMNLYTDRQSLQLTTTADLVAKADYYVMERGSTYSQVLLSTSSAQAIGFVEVWENDRFVIWHNTHDPDVVLEG